MQAALAVDHHQVLSRKLGWGSLDLLLGPDGWLCGVLEFVAGYSVDGALFGGGKNRIRLAEVGQRGIQ